MGWPDRLFRFGVGFLSLGIATMLEGAVLQWVFGAVGLYGIGTAVAGYCPILHALGMNDPGRKE
jgi:vacuolar-type H+-ATPase subunit I/STV1